MTKFSASAFAIATFCASAFAQATESASVKPDVEATADRHDGVVVSCTYRDTTREQIVKVNGIAVFMAASGQARAVGSTREDATSKLTAAGYGTDKKPCIEVRVQGPDIAEWHMSGKVEPQNYGGGSASGSN